MRRLALHIGVGFSALSACAAPSYSPGTNCIGGSAVEAHLGGDAEMGVSNEGPTTDVDLQMTALVRPGRVAIGCGEAAPRSEF